MTTIASCVVVGLGMTAATPAGSAGAYLGTRASKAPLNQPARDAQWEARQARSEQRIRAIRAAQRASDPKPLIGPPARPAATITVTNCDDAGPGSLRQALLDAVSGDVIDMTTLGCSTITLSSGQLVSAGDVELRGPGHDQLTIDGNSQDRVLRHVDGTVSIAGVTIANGRTDSGYGGGCISVHGNISLTDSIVTGCVAGSESINYTFGGGLDVYGPDDLGNVQLINSTVSGNSAVSNAYGSHGGTRGGGIYASGYVVAKYGSKIISNTATGHNGAFARGGGVSAQEGVVIAVGSEVSDNLVQALGQSSGGDAGTAYGGGIHSSGTQNAVLLSSITGNTAYSEHRWSYGGGMHVGDWINSRYGLLALVGSTVSGNTARTDCEYCLILGGGASVIGRVYGKYSTVSDNSVIASPVSSSSALGGGVAVTNPYDLGGPDHPPAAITLINSTISGNSVSGGVPVFGAPGVSGVASLGSGGGLAVLDGAINIVNSTITLNSASHAGGGVHTGSVYAHGTGTYLEQRLVSSIVANNSAPEDPDLYSMSGPGSVVLNGGHNLVTAAGISVVVPPDTISADPQLQPLAMNGGPTATHALMEGSPAIDAGSNPEGASEDQRAAPFVREWGAAADIGAFELQPDPYPIFSDGFEGSD